MNTRPLSHTPDFSELTNIVYSLGERVRQEMLAPLNVEMKDGNELVTHIDKLIEKLARKMITDSYGDVGIVGEESPETTSTSNIRFIIDPLDGTESFINREFNTTISIGVEVDGKIIHGVVYDFMRDILYEGGEDSQVYLQQKPWPLLRQRYSGQIKILLSGRGEEVEEMRAKLRSIPDIQLTQMYGSVALQTSQTAAGGYDGYLRIGRIKTWDIAGAHGFIHGVNDTSIFSREGDDFDHLSPEQGVIVVRKDFKNRFLELVTS